MKSGGKHKFSDAFQRFAENGQAEVDAPQPPPPKKSKTYKASVMQNLSRREVTLFNWHTEILRGRKPAKCKWSLEDGALDKVAWQLSKIMVLIQQLEGVACHDDGRVADVEAKYNDLDAGVEEWWTSEQVRKRMMVGRKAT